MSINVRWENDNQTAILFVFNGQWTWMMTFIKLLHNQTR